MLNFIKTKDLKNYYFDGEKYWRLMSFINDSYTYQAVTPEYSYTAGLAFGEFQSMLSDIDQELGETIPSFHNIELRLNQLREAVEKDAVGRVKEVQYYIDEIEKRAEAMCLGEQLYREGKPCWGSCWGSQRLLRTCRGWALPYAYPQLRG